MGKEKAFKIQMCLCEEICLSVSGLANASVLIKAIQKKPHISHDVLSIVSSKKISVKIYMWSKLKRIAVLLINLHKGINQRVQQNAEMEPLCYFQETRLFCAVLARKILNNTLQF